MSDSKQPVTVIGDVHGQYSALVALLEIIPSTSFLVFAGDFIHKGPDPKKVVDLVRELVEDGRAWAVRGNHDNTAGKGGGARQEWGLTDEDREWLKSLPLFVRRDKVLVVHGGMDREAEQIIMRLTAQGALPHRGDWDPEWVNHIMEYVHRADIKTLESVLMYTRFVCGEGYHVPDECAQYGVDPHWAQWYRGRLGHICFGHQPWQWSARFEHATGLDTGAGETSRLSFGRLSPRTCGVDEFLVHPRGLFAQEFWEGRRTDWYSVRTESPPSLREELEAATTTEQVKELSMEVAHLQRNGAKIHEEILTLVRAKL